MNGSFKRRDTVRDKSEFDKAARRGGKIFCSLKTFKINVLKI